MPFFLKALFNDVKNKRIADQLIISVPEPQLDFTEDYIEIPTIVLQPSTMRSLYKDYAKVKLAWTDLDAVQIERIRNSRGGGILNIFYIFKIKPGAALTAGEKKVDKIIINGLIFLGLTDAINERLKQFARCPIDIINR